MYNENVDDIVDVGVVDAVGDLWERAVMCFYVIS